MYRKSAKGWIKHFDFIILDAVEYDGRIYCEKDAVFAPGWRECYGEGFYNADLTEFEPEEE